MSYKITFQYLGDPKSDVTLMFVGEFRALNPNRETVIRNAHMEVLDRFPVVDVICDACSKWLADHDPCALLYNGSRLHCWECFTRTVRPHIVAE